jgi:hypothetical protein
MTTAAVQISGVRVRRKGAVGKVGLQFASLFGGELGLAPAQSTLGPGRSHALNGPHGAQLGLAVTDDLQRGEKHRPQSVGGVMNRPSKRQCDAAVSQRRAQPSDVVDRSRQAGEAGDHEHVPWPNRCQCLIQARSRAGQGGKRVIEIDPLPAHAKNT